MYTMNYRYLVTCFVTKKTLTIALKITHWPIVLTDTIDYFLTSHFTKGSWQLLKKAHTFTIWLHRGFIFSGIVWDKNLYFFNLPLSPKVSLSFSSFPCSVVSSLSGILHYKSGDGPSHSRMNKNHAHWELKFEKKMYTTCNYYYLALVCIITIFFKRLISFFCSY